MTIHHHDDHLASAIQESYTRIETTAEVADRVAVIVTEFERFRHQVRHIAALAGIALGTALAAGIAVVVIR